MSHRPDAVQAKMNEILAATKRTCRNCYCYYCPSRSYDVADKCGMHTEFDLWTIMRAEEEAVRFVESVAA